MFAKSRYGSSSRLSPIITDGIFDAINSQCFVSCAYIVLFVMLQSSADFPHYGTWFPHFLTLFIGSGTGPRTFDGTISYSKQSSTTCSATKTSCERVFFSIAHPYRKVATRKRRCAWWRTQIKGWNCKHSISFLSCFLCEERKSVLGVGASLEQTLGRAFSSCLFSETNQGGSY